MTKISYWETSAGELKVFKQLTHQHLSNIYWYHLIFANKNGMPRQRMLSTSNMALEQLKKRFNGQILDWEPLYTYEIRWLYNLDILASGIRIRNYEIFLNEKRIGKIVEENLVEVKGVN